MAQKLPQPAKEGSTYIIRADFYSKTSDGSPETPVTPNAGLTWTLLDEDRNVVNDRLDEPIDPAETVYIVLTGEDLALKGSNANEKRYVTINGTYNSALGTNLKILDEAVFQIGDSWYKPRP